jgi:small subunit ribosomal protein S4
MARNFSPRGRLERRERLELFLFSGVTERDAKIKKTLPGQLGSKSSKSSEYLKQLRAKQFVKRLYGILEKQFKNYFKKAKQASGATGENLLRLLECRLDNVVYRLGFARTRKEARQLVSHKSILIKNKKINRVVNIPSYQVCTGDEIHVREKSCQQGRVKEAVELAKQRVLPDWLQVFPEEHKGLVTRMPERSEMPHDINESLIVELYSK